MDPPHPLGIAASEVVVDGHDVDALARKRVQVAGQGRDEGLAFPRAHLRDAAVVQRHAADHLDIVMAHPERSHAGFADRRERLAQDVVERRSVIELLLELGRDRLQLAVALAFIEGSNVAI